MLSHRCVCGQAYRLPDSSAGKKARCKKCGVIFEVPKPEPVPRSNPDDFLLAEFTNATQRPVQKTALVREVESEADYDAPREYASSPHRPESATAAPEYDGSAGRMSKYLQDVLWSFLFPTNPSNLIVFIIVWLVLCFSATLLAAAGPFGMFGQLIVFGWYAAFRFNCLAAAAGGDEDLPSLSMSEGLAEDIALPALRWLGSWFLVLIPALGQALYSIQDGTMTSGELVSALAGGLAGLLGGASGGVMLFVGLICAGLFLWPIVALCIGLGGWDSVARVDLMALTLGRTILAYIPTVGLVFGTAFLSYWLQEMLAARMVAGKTGLGAMMGAVWAWVVLVVAIGLYFEIVAMRAIGLYYRHFKSRFAWDWG